MAFTILFIIQLTLMAYLCLAVSSNASGLRLLPLDDRLQVFVEALVEAILFAIIGNA